MISEEKKLEGIRLFLDLHVQAQRQRTACAREKGDVQAQGREAYHLNKLEAIIHDLERDGLLPGGKP